MPNIDELNIQISADAKKAIDSLDRLSASLLGVGKSAKYMFSATNSIKGFSTAIGNINTEKINDLANSLTNLKSLGNIDIKINMEKPVNDAKIWEQSVKEVSAKSGEIGQELSKAFNIAKSDLKELQPLLDQLVQTSANAHFENLERDLENVQRKIMEVGTASNEELKNVGASIDDQLINEYQNFLNYLKAHPVKFSDMYGTGDMHATLFNSGILKNYVSARGAEIDTVFREYMRDFPSLFKTTDADLINPDDMADSMVRAIMQAKEGVKKRVTFNDLFDIDESLGAGYEESVKQKLMQVVNDVTNAQREAVKQNTASAKDINSLFDVDPEALASKIQSAVNTAAAKQYPFKLRLSVDSSAVTTAIKNSMATIDVSSVTSLATAMETLNTSLHRIPRTESLNGLKNFFNSLSNLSKNAGGDFNASGINAITDAVRGIASLGDISGSVTKLIQAISKLAGLTNEIENTSKALPQLNAALREMITGIMSAGGLPAQLDSFVQSIQRLTKQADKMPLAATNLKVLGDSISTVIRDLQNAGEINDSITRFVDSLARLASTGGNAGRAVNAINRAMSSSQRTFTKGASGLETFVNAMKKIDGFNTNVFRGINSIVNKLVSNIKNLTSGTAALGHTAGGINRLNYSFKNLLATMTGFYGVISLVNWFKDAISYASDITELRNVVDVSFGDMAGKIYNFTKTTKERFGVAERDAMHYAGTLMSMFNASGVAHDRAAQMAVDLTALAGDLASFYNIEPDVAFKKIQSGMSGMVMPLRSLGISMTVANLQAYALSQGINKTYREMTNAEQQLLRYNYLLSVTTNQQGDYARTFVSWANQVRLLSLSFKEFGGYLGQGFISVLQHVVRWLNKVMSYLIAAAKLVRNFLYAIFGAPEASSSGIEIDVSGLADESGDYADNMADAAKSAKDTADELGLLPFDELNLLNTKASGSGGAGGGGGGLGDMGDFGDGLIDLGAFEDAESLDDLLSDWGDRMKEAIQDQDWKSLGEYIAAMINEGLLDLYKLLTDPTWLNKAIDGIKAFGDTVNAIIDGLDWYLLGKDFGAAINDVAELALTFLDAIHWNDLGKGFAKSVNGLVDEVNWKQVGRAIGQGYMTIWEIANGFVHELDWGDIGNAIADGLNGLFERVRFKKIADTLVTGINGTFTSLASFTKKFKWKDFAKNVEEGLNKAIHGIKWRSNARALNEFIQSMLDTLVDIADNTDWRALGEGIAQALAEIDWVAILKKTAHIIIEVLGGLLEGLASEPVGRFVIGLGAAFGTVKAITGLSSFVLNIAKTLLPLMALFGQTGNAAGAFVNAMNFGSASAQLMTLSGAANTLGKAAGSSISSISGFIGAIMATPVGQIAGMAGAIMLIAEACKAVEEHASSIARNNLSDLFTGSGAGGTLITQYAEDYDRAVDNIVTGATKMQSAFEKMGNQANAIKETKENVESLATALANGVASPETAAQFASSLQTYYTELTNYVTQSYGTVTNALANQWAYVAKLNGTDNAEIMERLAAASQDVTDKVSQQQKRIQDLQNELKTGKISTAQYNNEVKKLAIEMSKSNGTFSKLEATTSSYSRILSGYADNVSFATDASGDYSESLNNIKDAISSMGESAESGKSRIKDYGESVESSIVDMAEVYSQFTDSMSQDDWVAILQQNLSSIDMSVGTIDSSLTEGFNKLQTSLANNMRELPNAAAQAWQEMNWVDKLAFSNDFNKFEAKFIQSYKNDFLYPAAEEIDKAYSEAGINSTAWIDEWADDTTTKLGMMPGLFGDTIVGLNIDSVFESTMSSQLNNIGTYLEQSGSQAAAKYPEAFSQTMQNDMPKITKTIETTTKAVTDSINAMFGTGAEEDAKGNGGNLAQAVADGWNTSFNSNLSAAQQAAINFAGSQIQSYSSTMNDDTSASTAASNLAAKASEALQIDPATAKQHGTDFVAGFTGGITEATETAVGDLNAFNETLDTAFTDYWVIGSPSKKMQDYGAWLLEGLAIGITNDESLTAITEAFQNLADTITGYFVAGDEGGEAPLSKEQFSIYATDMIQGFIDGINENYPLTTEPMQAWVDEIIQTFVGEEEEDKINATAFGSYAEKIVTGFNDGITSHLESSKSPMQQWGQSIIDSFKELISPEIFNDLGAQVVKGFNEGIEKNMSSTAGVMQKWAKGASDAMSKNLQIHSPSKVFREKGIYTVLGYNEGVKGQMYSTDGIMQEWSKSITAADMVPNIPNIQMANAKPSSFGAKGTAESAIIKPDRQGLINDIETAIVATLTPYLSVIQENSTITANKDLTISSREAFNSVRSEANEYFKRNGRSPFYT